MRRCVPFCCLKSVSVTGISLSNDVATFPLWGHFAQTDPASAARSHPRGGGGSTSAMAETPSGLSNTRFFCNKPVGKVNGVIVGVTMDGLYLLDGNGLDIIMGSVV